ncbi:hypothetical protein CDG77_22145 [Nostoc sp. 'Peltigera membranacea cyanobiont' 213]|nr:hypothetical protein CDG77_22145 [Nostoc sp. 'Peltigera membranacea cyanobiont' 213]
MKDLNIVKQSKVWVVKWMLINLGLNYQNIQVAKSKFPLIYLSKPSILIQVDFENSQKNLYFDKGYS